MSVEEFHGITLGPTDWDKRTSYQAFYARVNERLVCTTLDERAQKALQRLVWRKAYEAMFLAMEGTFRRDAKRLAGNSYYRCTDAIGQARSRIGSKYFARQINKDITKLPSLVDTFLARVEAFITETKDKLRKRHATAEEDQQEDLPPPAKKQRKECLYWTAPEDAILIQGVNQGKKWCMIAQNLPDRSNVDCKDRHRTLKRQGKVK